MRDAEVIQVAHMRHQSTALLNVFGTDTEKFEKGEIPSEEYLDQAFKEMESVFDSKVLIEFINDIGPKIMSTIVHHEGGLEQMMAAKELFPQVDDIWISGVMNVGIHMFYLGMHASDIKLEEKKELSDQFQKILSKLDPKPGDEDAREETEK